MQRTAEQIEKDLLKPIFTSSVKYKVAVTLAAGLYACRRVCIFSISFTTGLACGEINSPVFWAFDITNFVFWIGISHAGTLISAICDSAMRRGGGR